MKAFVIQHLAFEHLGNVEVELIHHGYEISYFNACDSNDLAIVETSSADLLVVLGGPIGVYEEENYPFLATEKKIISHYIALNKPILGICLGAQLIASVLGAKVYPGGHKEIGWGPISLDKKNIPSWFPDSLDGQRVLHWHGDTFDIPSGATRISSSDIYQNQGFTYGESILALQFHLEVCGPSFIEDWLVGHACEISSAKGVDVKTIRRDTTTYQELMQPHASSLWKAWLGLIQ